MEFTETPPLRVATMKWFHFIGWFVGIGLLFVITLAVSAAAGPKVLDTYHKLASEEGIDMSVNQSEFVWGIDHVGPLNQRLLFKAEIENLFNDDEGAEQLLHTHINLYGSHDRKDWELTFNGGRKLATYRVRCVPDQEWCRPVVLIHEFFIHYQYYKIEVEFLDLEEESHKWVGDVKFSWDLVYHRFTMFELYFRFIFVIISVIVLAVFWFSIRNRPLHSWAYEHKWAFALNLALIAYNNPLFPLDVVLNSWLPAFFDAVFSGTFLVTLFAFWLCYFDSLRKSKAERTFGSFYASKGLLLGFLWLAFIVTFTWEQVHSLDDPTYSEAREVPYFVFIEAMIGIVLAVYVVWVVYVVAYGWSERARFPLIQTQLNLVGGLSFVLLCLTAALILFDVIRVMPNNAVGFLGFLTLYNFYVYTIVLLWMPPFGAAPEENNASFMVQLDESSDDIASDLRTRN